MNVDAHHTVRRLYVQLLRAQHGDAGEVTRDEKEEEEPDPVPPVSCHDTTARNPLSHTVSSAHAGAADATTRGRSADSSAAVAVSSSSASPPAARLPRWSVPVGPRAVASSSPARSAPTTAGAHRWWRRWRARHSRQRCRLPAAATEDAEETASAGRVRRWKSGLARTLRERSLAVEERLRGMMATHVQRSLSAAAGSEEVLDTPPPPSVLVPLRVLSTGYAVTVQVRDTGAVDDAGRSRRARGASQTLLSPPLGDCASGAGDPEQRGDVYEESAGIPVTAVHDAAAAAATHRVSTATTLLTSPPLEAQLRGCQTHTHHDWESAGTSRNPLVSARTAALCTELHMQQTTTTTTTDAARAVASAPPSPQCTLWEHLPLSSSLHACADTSPGARERRAAPAGDHAARPAASPFGRLATMWRRRRREPLVHHTAPHAPRADAATAATWPEAAAVDPLAMTTDGDWHRLHARLRATQEACRQLGMGATATSAVDDAASPPPLSAFTPFCSPLLPDAAGARGAAEAVITVCYSAAPCSLDAVCWSTNGASPSVSLHPTWALCFVVDAAHEAWLRRTLLEAATTTDTTIQPCSTTAEGVAALRHDVSMALQSMRTYR
ncbi:hypothetical protein NESM_000769500 [Novymonas esmeraldas]|uniref:Uncharacterized protein n=1 Tax=Novymonas esmeraldas TaxID=1808958 RepID=A0AAW0EYC5_9TRYP